MNAEKLKVIKGSTSRSKINRNLFYDLLKEFEKLNVNIRKLPNSTPEDITMRELLINIAKDVLFDDYIISQIYTNNIFPSKLIAQYASIDREYIINYKNYFLAILAIFKMDCEPLINILTFENNNSKYKFSGIIIEKGIRKNLLFSNTGEFLTIGRDQDLMLGDIYKGVKPYSQAIVKKLFLIITIFIVFFLGLFLIYFNSTKAIVIVETNVKIDIKINPLNRAIGFKDNSKEDHIKDKLHIYGKDICSAIIDSIELSISDPPSLRREFTVDNTIFIKISNIENVSNLSKLEEYMEKNKFNYELRYNGKMLKNAATDTE